VVARVIVAGKHDHTQLMGFPPRPVDVTAELLATDCPPAD
jgi:hypothetical protein